MTTVLCFGTFDGLHPGHEDYFRQARDLGDRVCVVVSRDRTALEVKGQLPATNEEDRLRTVSVHPLVDEARLGYHDDKHRILEEFRPDIILLGYDQQAFTDDLERKLVERGIVARVLRAQPHEPERYKSSLLRAREQPFMLIEDDDALPL